MDPYLQDVVEATRGDFGRAREATLGTIGAQATAAGAFGGTRHGVAEGTALADIARAEGSTLAGLRSSGYQSAVEAALAQQGMLGNLGLGAAQMLNALNVQGAQAGIGRARRVAAWHLASGHGCKLRRVHAPNQSAIHELGLAAEHAWFRSFGADDNYQVAG